MPRFRGIMHIGAWRWYGILIIRQPEPPWKTAIQRGIVYFRTKKLYHVRARNAIALNVYYRIFSCLHLLRDVLGFSDVFGFILECGRRTPNFFECLFVWWSEVNMRLFTIMILFTVNGLCYIDSGCIRIQGT